MAVAGANQAGDLAYDLKVGSMIRARPEAQIKGQVIGSVFGAFVSCGIYKLYASQYPIPGPLFRVPSAYLVLSTGRLLLGRGLPEGVLPFTVAAACLSATSTLLKIYYEDRWWPKLVPSGVSFAIGLFGPTARDIPLRQPSLTSGRYLPLTIVQYFASNRWAILLGIHTAPE